jgi:hypothetical protein
MTDEQKAAEDPGETILRLRHNLIALLELIGANEGECRGCHQAIYWIKTKRGKPCPIDIDGAVHFSTCPQAANFRKGRSDAKGKASHGSGQGDGG